MKKGDNFLDIRNFNTHQVKSASSSTSLDRATGILISLGNGINTVTDIARHLRYSTATVHRLLQTLKRLKWVIQDDHNHKYYLGPMITQLFSNRVGAHKYVIMHALQEMERLADFTEETISLTVMVQMHCTLLHEIISPHNLAISESIKKSGPPFNGAMGKVLLSQLEPEELKVTLKQIKVGRDTENTVIDKKLLMKQIEDIWRQGYCLTCFERIPGVVCISVPINRYFCPACLSVVGPESRLRPKAEKVIIELKASSRRISGDIATAFS